MKCKTIDMGSLDFQWMILLLLFTINISSCKDDKDMCLQLPMTQTNQ